ncbi:MULTISPECIES: UDP-glucose 4-epimerase GalE [Primorskyibacter]|uniref:UDP-glucose 4-epimerase n=1 Tax=Primorskyibacter flagellatus TaxID=1387277 RepID=A0A1W2EKM0_9RHOB|nr:MULTISPECIES: UDP-glucose 4-epimerase GalE [Primorskyibacter]SMD10301.1 UDP-glucose 4-epimerase [Primorskyibacter flagellatus]
MAKILVCGGAGYIGSHMVRQLVQNNYDVVVFDNLSQGNADAVGDVPLVQGDLLNRDALDAVFAEHDFDAVYHFAALIAVGESVAAPDIYYRNNVTGTLNLLDAMRVARVDKFVFSSTAAIFGNPQAELIDEGHPKVPLNPYGRSKLMIEQVLADYGHAFGIRSVFFRYFNAAGAHTSGEIGEAHDPETHLVPNVLLAAMGERDGLEIFGDDYDTRDGTNIRDYIHIDDIASAHLTALDYMEKNPGTHAFNLGNGNGFSNKEVINAAEKVIGKNHKIPYRIAPRRAGDAAVLVADSRRAREELGWSPQTPDIETIIETAWNWHRAPKFGPFAK